MYHSSLNVEILWGENFIKVGVALEKSEASLCLQIFAGLSGIAKSPPL